MDVPTPPPIVLPEPIRRNGFQFDGAFKTIDGVAFERPQHLLRLCYPSEPEKWKIKLGRGRPPKMEKITDLEAARTLSRKFMLAQFRFYGIPPPYQSSSDEVLGIFQEQVTQGNVGGIFFDFLHFLSCVPSTPRLSVPQPRLLVMAIG